MAFKIKPLYSKNYPKGTMQEAVVRNGRLYNVWVKGKDKYIKVGKNLVKI